MNPLSWVSHLVSLALSPIRWAWKLFQLIREAKSHEQAILANCDLIARELQANANLVAAYSEGAWMMGNIQSMLQTTRWDQLGGALSIWRKKYPDLWAEVAEAYAAIQLTKTTASEPPTPEVLSGLAQRIQGAAL